MQNYLHWLLFSLRKIHICLVLFILAFCSNALLSSPDISRKGVFKPCWRIFSSKSNPVPSFILKSEQIASTVIVWSVSNASSTPVALIVSNSPDSTDDKICRYSVLSSTINIRFISFCRLLHGNLDCAWKVCTDNSDVVRSCLKLNGNTSAGRFRKHLLL